VPVYDRLRARFTPVRDGVAPRSYVDAQRLYDQISPWGWRNYWKTNGMGALDHSAIGTLHEIFDEAASPLSQVQLEHLHGALHRSAPGSSALNFVGAKYDLLVNAKWTDPARDGNNVRCARALPACSPSCLGARTPTTFSRRRVSAFARPTGAIPTGASSRS